LDDVIWATTGPFMVTTRTGAETQLPKMRKLRDMAIVADIVSSPTRVDTCHVQGFNVLYSHGAARWFHRKDVDAALEQCLGAFAPSKDVYQDQIWARFDQP
jgi:hypothetical protein